jgi:hypothetical protein
MIPLVAEPENIQCFNAAVRAVLTTLYQAFPKPLVIESPKLLSKLPEYCAKPWGPFHGDDNVVAATVRFLREEGYLRYTGDQDDRQTFFPGAVLTSRGFAVLHRPLASLTPPDQTVGQRLQENLTVSDLTGLVTGLLQSGLALLGR